MPRQSRAESRAVVERIREARRNAPAARSLLVAVTGIDGLGKGFAASRIVAELRTAGLRAEPINIDGWLNLPGARFNDSNPADHFYKHGIVSRSCSLSLCCRFATPGHFVWKRTSRKKPPRRIGAMSRVLGPGRDCARGHLPAQAGIRAALRPLNLDRVQLRTALECAVARAQEGLPPDETMHAYRTTYFPAQQLHFRRDNPKTTATLILGNDPRLLSRGPFIAQPRLISSV